MIVNVNSHLNDRSGKSSIKASQQVTDITIKFFVDTPFYDESDIEKPDLFMMYDINSGVVTIYGNTFSYGMPVVKYEITDDKKLVSTTDESSYPPQLTEFISAYLDLDPASDAEIIQFMEKVRKIFEFYVKKFI